jgi:hypothetical protein
MGLVVYIAGPMRGIPFYNFAAFDKAKVFLLKHGHRVISPADMDRENGFDPWTLPNDHDWESLDGFDLRAAIRRDLVAIQESDAIFMLEGWQNSKGATVEKSVAEWLGLDVFYEFKGMNQTDASLVPTPAKTIAPVAEDVLEEALRITKGDRNASYGPPDQDFTRTAAMWSALKGVTFEAREVALFMIALKLSRETHQRKRDNWVDVAGYARCGSLCR